MLKNSNFKKQNLNELNLIEAKRQIRKRHDFCRGQPKKIPILNFKELVGLKIVD